MKSHNILLIQNDSDLQTELQDLLVYEGYRVFCVQSAEDAWDLLARESVDLVLSGLRLKDTDGFAFLKEFRSQSDFSFVAFVFLTARADSHDYRHAMNLGADDYLVKPIGSQDLLNAIEARLERIRILQAQARQALVSQERFLLSYFPHAFFSPLNTLLGLTQTMRLQSNSLIAPKFQHYLESMHRNGLHLFHLLQKQLMFLELSSSDPMKPKQIAEMVELSPVLQKIANERAQYYQRTTDLQVQIESCQVRILQKHLEVLLHELIDNAFKFSQAGTHIVIKMKLLEDCIYLQILNLTTGFVPAIAKKTIELDPFELGQEARCLGLFLVQKILNYYNYTWVLDSVAARYTQIEIQFANSEA